jgi:hypothetical protein
MKTAPHPRERNPIPEVSPVIARNLEKLALNLAGGSTFNLIVILSRYLSGDQPLCMHVRYQNYDSVARCWNDRSLFSVIYIYTGFWSCHTQSGAGALTVLERFVLVIRSTISRQKLRRIRCRHVSSRVVDCDGVNAELSYSCGNLRIR